MKKQVAQNWWQMGVIILIITIIGTLYVVNKTTEQAYNFGACTFNDFDCDIEGWDGVCNQEIEDECCDYVDIRWCGGHEEDYIDCWDKYCESDGYKCEGVIDITGGYNCNCLPVYGVN